MPFNPSYSPSHSTPPSSPPINFNLENAPPMFAESAGTRQNSTTILLGGGTSNAYSGILFPVNSIEPSSLKLKILHLWHRYVWVFPLLFALIIPVICFGSYFASLYYKHVEPLLPYISDSATHYPQAAYFSQGMTLSGMLMFICVFYRYKQIKHYLTTVIMDKAILNSGLAGVAPGNGFEVHQNFCMDADERRKVGKLCFMSVLFGYASSFGMFIIGNFRLGENIYGHLFGVAFAFNGGVIYAILTVMIIYRLNKCGVESAPISISVVIAICVIGFLMTSGCALVACLQIGFPTFFDASFRHRYSPEMTGYTWFVLSTVGEWVAILAYSPLHVCLANRFYRFAVNYPEAFKYARRMSKDEVGRQKRLNSTISQVSTLR